jgi:M6 family metalloprotease-like protein
MGTLDRRRFGVLRGLGLLLLLVAISVGPARAQLNAPAQGQATAGTAVALEGEIEIIHEDFKNSGRYLYFLKTSAGRRLTLHFAKHPPTNLLTGDHVSVRGSQSGTTVMLASGGNVTNLARTQPPAPPPTGPLPNTLGAQSTLVILVNFQDAPTNQPYTVADAQSVVFGTASAFFLENSYKQTWLTGDVVGWYTIPVSSTTCEMSSIASYAQAAASAAGINLSAYTHYVYAFPQNNSCGFGGSSFIGGRPSQSWINGIDGNGSLDLHVLDHELGHAFGLWHSHLLDCGSSATIGSNCALNEYGDLLDTMGVPQTASPDYNSFQKERLGWLNYGMSPAITTVTASGTYLINAYELASLGPNALKILKSTDPTTGAKTWYYMEARQAVGFDAFLTDGTCLTCYVQNETNGVLFHIGTDDNGNSGDLLDMTPATPTYYGWFDPSLMVGQSFQDPAVGVTITTDWVTSTQAAVNVKFSGGVTIATGQQSYLPGQTATTTATATYGGSPVANVSVSFTITKANGNVVTGSANTGSNGTAVYKLKLMKNDPAGTYLAAAAAMIKGNPHNATTDFAVQ